MTSINTNLGLNNPNSVSQSSKTKRKDTPDNTEGNKSVASSSSDRLSLSEEGMQLDSIFKQISSIKQSLSENPEAAAAVHGNLNSLDTLKMFDEEYAQNISGLDSIKNALKNNPQIAGTIHQNLKENALNNI